MSDTFVSLFNSSYIQNRDPKDPFRIMLYNGDVDLDVITLEAEYFAETLASTLGARVIIDRTLWNYERPGPNSRVVEAGFKKAWYFKDQKVHLDLVTIKVCRQGATIKFL